MSRQRFPSEALRGERVALSSQPLPLLSGSMPEGLDGHWFVVAAIGTPSATSIPARRSTPFLNGEGVIFRLDLTRGGIRATSATVENLSFKADLLASQRARYKRFRFNPMGISRGNPLALGTRDMSNTALVPWRRTATDPPVILACYDGGRPHLVDAETLETLGPVSPTPKWEAQMSGDRLCPQLMSGAHPAYDPRTEELFVVNYSRNLKDFLFPTAAVAGRFGVELSFDDQDPSFVRTFVEKHLDPGSEHHLRWLTDAEDARDEDLSSRDKQLGRDLSEVESLLDTSGWSFDLTSGEIVWDAADKGLEWVVPWVRRVLRTAFRILELGVAFIARPARRLVHLHRHHDGHLDRFELQVDGEPIRIRGSVHQIAVTKRFVVVADTSFKFELDFILSSRAGRARTIRRWLRDHLSARQLDHTPLYLVPREALTPGAIEPVPVQVIPARLEKGTVHYFAQYDDSEGVRLLCVHSDGMDVAEFLDDVDYDAVTGSPVSPELHGLFCGPTDTSPIRVNTVRVQDGTTSVIHVEAGREWGVGLGCAVGNPGPADRGSIERTFWTASGLVPGIVSRRVRELYFAPGVDREVSEADWESAMVTGTASSVFRVDVGRSTASITDRWLAPLGWTLSTPQFVPHTSEPAHDGFLLCTAFSDVAPTRRILVFDASRLANGPIAVLDASPLRWPFTLHSAWLPEVRRVEVRSTARDPIPAASGTLGELYDELRSL